MNTAAASRMVCHECDLLVAVPALAIGQKAFCPRCNFLLAANRPNALNMITAFSISGLLFLALANAFPFLGFRAGGQERTITLLESIGTMVGGNLPSLAMIVFATIIAIPSIVLLGIIYVSTALVRSQELPHTSVVLRWVLRVLPWGMAEIFLIGILVSFIKIATLADIALELSFWSYVLFTFCMTVVVLHLDKRDIWRRVEELEHG